MERAPAKRDSLHLVGIWGTLRNNSGLRGMPQFGETRDGQVVKNKTDRTSTKEAFLVSFLSL